MSLSSPIRVLHVITRMVKGGAQENTLANAAGLRGDGWESLLAAGHAAGPEGSLEGECESAGVRLVRIPELVRELSPREDLAALRGLEALMRRERPHLVHTHTSKAGILGRVAARRAGVPAVVHTPHGHVFHGYGGRMKTEVFIRAERVCAPRADRLVALTETERREHLDLRIGCPDQWRVVHSGIDFRPFEAARGERERVRAELGMPAGAVVLGCVARLVPIKGHVHLVDAFARLARGRQDLHLLLVGDGPLREALVRQAREQGLNVVEEAPRGGESRADAAASGVHFVGLRRDVPRLLAAMDLFVLPSLNEGMGRVLVEAMAMELPCVASRVSGIPDVVEEGRTGLLVPPADPEALARALETLLADPGRRRAMGTAGRAKAVPEFGVERMVEKLEALYREVLAEKGIPAPAPTPPAEPRSGAIRPGVWG